MNKCLGGNRFRVLLAEDDEVGQEIVRVFLREAADADLTVVGDGRAALEAALTVRYDLLILDQNLPFITGDRVVRHLGAGNTRNSATPILRLSASIDAVGTRRTGALTEVLLPKPLSAELFITTVRGILEPGHRAVA